MALAPHRMLSADEVARLAGTTVDRVEAMREVGLLKPDADARYASGDVHRVRVVTSFVAAGIPLDVLVRATDSHAITFDYYDRLHGEPGPISMRTYGEVLASVGDRNALLSRLFAALGLVEPDPTASLRLEDERLLLVLLDMIDATGTPDLGLRVARLLGDGLRQAIEAVMTVYGEAVERMEGSVTGIPSRDVFERSLEPWSRLARLAPELGRWLTDRHLTSAIDGFSVTATEAYLGDAGFIPIREKAPTAVAFVDLVGYTRLAAERGDQVAADVALDFADRAALAADRVGGRVVKLLGDGVLMRFDAPAGGVEASLALLADLESVGPTGGHAGLAVGPVIEHDGDIFGATVNLAARIADVAGPGTLLTEAGCARHLEGQRYVVEGVGPVSLQGLIDPVELIRVTERRVAAEGGGVSPPSS